jgi:hypothetical protein
MKIINQSLHESMFSESFPCNPRPFLTGLNEFVTANGTDSLKSDEAKQILWTIIAQAYGQLTTIDMADEWTRLNKAKQGEAQS